MKVSKVAQSCPTFCDPMGYSLPGSSLHGILQARVLEWVAIKRYVYSGKKMERNAVEMFLYFQSTLLKYITCIILVIAIIYKINAIEFWNKMNFQIKQIITYIKVLIIFYNKLSKSLNNLILNFYSFGSGLLEGIFLTCSFPASISHGIILQK